MKIAAQVFIALVMLGLTFLVLWIVTGALVLLGDWIWSLV